MGDFTDESGTENDSRPDTEIIVENEHQSELSLHHTNVVDPTTPYKSP